ncbi:MAG: T9SS type A sorting domain-containing protein [Bacteroidales bacterium]|nr:T9SS type A sorting domain-containing protein [Bacteroidales bacterium]
MPGDIIGIFTPDGLCAGQVEVTQPGEGLALVAFGNEEISSEKEGFDYGEMFQFKVYRQSTGEELLMEVDFNPALPNMANFSPHGLSAAKSLKLQALGVSELADNQINIYPNPTTGIFNLSMSVGPEKTQIQLLDARGQAIKIYEFDKKPNGHWQSFDLSHLPKGVYFLKIANSEFMSFKKLVLQ